MHTHIHIYIYISCIKRGVERKQQQFIQVILFLVSHTNTFIQKQNGLCELQIKKNKTE